VPIQGLDVYAFSLIVQKQVPQPRSFFVSLNVHDNIMFKYSCDQAFRLVVGTIPSFHCNPGDKHSTRKRKTCRILSKISMTRKNVMCENSPLFQVQHRYFLHNKFFVNDESLQIHELACCWEDCNRSIAVECDVS